MKIGNSFIRIYHGQGWSIFNCLINCGFYFGLFRVSCNFCINIT